MYGTLLNYLFIYLPEETPFLGGLPAAAVQLKLQLEVLTLVVVVEAVNIYKLSCKFKV